MTGQTATAHMFYHRTYCNRIARTEAEELDGIAYSVELPKDLMTSMAAILKAGRGAENAV